ncbi:MAG TPA: phage tail sheath subtilisin-like domain-containing protein [Chthoniobacteraceae bacterium]|nr:phage tail sheath subtilisin-like domain-containing protein [Chthoniobacteraceae bacterium]
MAEQFLHGVELIEVQSGPRPIRTVKSSVIGIVGTAPDAEPARAASATIGGLIFTAKEPGIAGNQVSVALVDPGENSASLSVDTEGSRVAVSLATNEEGEITTTEAQVATALTANDLVAASASGAGAAIVNPTPSRLLSGGADEAFPIGRPTLIAGSRQEAARLGETGTLPSAIDAIFDQVGAAVVVVRVEEDNDIEGTVTDVIGEDGIQALIGAESILGVSPRILIAPGFSDRQEVAGELLAVANRLRAVVIADGPNTTDAEAVSHAGDYGSDRLYIVDPSVKVFRAGAVVFEPASPRVAGLIALSDNERGFWWSPSNQEVRGILGTTRPIDFTFGDPNSRANLLNEANVATIIRQDGYRLWGNRTTSSDPKFAFLSVRRTADMINDSILRGHLWAVDRNITKTYLEDVSESVNAYLAGLKNQGAILGGRCWPDPDLNSPANIAQGKVYVNFEFTPPYPAEHITFKSIIVNDYLEELV